MQKYNGQLINQFPNSINGNAAAGAQITVRVKSSGSIAALYATDNLSGAALSNPLTADSKGYYGFYAPDGVYTLDVSISGTPQLEIQLQDVAALQAQFNDALANAGYIPVGTFAAGCTVSQSNGVVSDGSSFWRWDGALPKTVTAGSAPTPTGVGGWVLVGGDGLRGDLAHDDSAVLVGDAEAGALGSVSKFGELSFSQIIGNICKRGAKNVVITGDSLSYNYQDFDATVRNTAEACNVGIRSWSFMLRDIIHQQDAFFKHADDLDIGFIKSSSLLLENSASAAQIFPFGGRVTSLRALPAEAEIFTFTYSHSGDASTAYLVVLGDPSGFGATYSVSVDGGSVVNSTTVLSGSVFQGRRIVFLPIAVPNDGLPHIIRIYNLAQAATSPDASGLAQVNLIGISSKYTNVSITGVGGFSTTDLLTQWSSRAVSLNPDALIMIIGANDAYDGMSIATFKANLQNMVDQVRAVRPNCEFLLMSTPGSNQGSPFSVPDATTRQFVKAMYEFCLENRCGFFNTYKFFNSAQAANFRFDHIHFNRAGNSALCAEICNQLGLEYDSKDNDPNFSLINGQIFSDRVFKGSTLIASPSGTGTNPKTYSFAVRQGVAGVIKSVISTDGETVVITFNRPISKLGTLSIMPYGFVAQLLTPVVSAAYSTNTMSFKIVKAGGTTLIQHADYPVLFASLSFLLTYS